MSLEEGLITWLNRSTKTKLENLIFGINAWKSSELHSNKKYEIILNWFSENSSEIFQEDVRAKIDCDGEMFTNISEFLKLKCPISGCINHIIKLNFIKSFIKYFKSHEEFEGTRKATEILYELLENELFQDVYKFDYHEFCILLGLTFSSYNNYLHSLTKDDFLVKSEGEFFEKITKYLRDFVKRLPENALTVFTEEFSTATLTPFIEIQIILKSNGLRYFEDLLEIEKILYLDYTKTTLKMYEQWPIHVNLMNFECSMINLRGNKLFYEKLLKLTFDKLSKIEKVSEPEQYLTVQSYVLNLLRKYEVSLNFTIKNIKAIDFLSSRIEVLVMQHYKENLYEILCLLCSTIKLNPLILESNIFKLAVPILLIKKSNKEYNKFDEFLILIMDMFKKLSRGEKLVSNLLKGIKDHLRENIVSKKLKRSLVQTSEISPKKLKTDSLIEADATITTTNESSEILNSYIKILIEDFNEIKESRKFSIASSFSYISNVWPIDTVGFEFSKFISTLMSKPSIVIWKTIIYSLSEQVDNLKELKSNDSNENLLFIIDFHSILLCNYFGGSRLPEHLDKFMKEINEGQKLTSDLLRNFGKAILNIEHNNRIMNAFLEVCKNFGLFSLILLHYYPDSLKEKIDIPELMNGIFDFLTADEWNLMEQRIINFGKHEAKLNMNRILIEKFKLKLLLNENKNMNINLKSILLSYTLNDSDQTKTIFTDANHQWINKFLNDDQKYQLCENIVNTTIQNDGWDVEKLKCFTEDSKFLEMITIQLYKILAKEGFTKKSRKSILNSVEFNNILNEKDSTIENLVQIIYQQDEDITIKNYDADKIEQVLNILDELPIGYVREDVKVLSFTLNLALYRDLLATRNQKLSDKAFSLFDGILHFGQQIEIFKVFKIEQLLKLISPLKSEKFYEFVFHSLKKSNNISEQTLKRLVEIMSENENLSDENIKLIQIAIDVLSNQMNAKQFRTYLNQLIDLYAKYINDYFSNNTNNNADNDRKFVEKTLQAFSVYMNLCISKSSKPSSEEAVTKFSDEFIKICKIYVAYSINCHNSYAIKLMNSVLNHSNQLQFSENEIQFVLKEYWDRLKSDFKSNEHIEEKNVDSIFKFIMLHKTNEQFRDILVELGEDTKEENVEYICKIASLISKSPLSLIKGGIFNEYFKRITFGIVMKLERNQSNQFVNNQAVLRIINAQKSLCLNQKIPISPDLIDDILSFLMDVNMKKFILDDKNINLFFELHKNITDLCTALIKCRSSIILDRVVQYSHVYKDLVQSLCWYKADRQKDLILPQTEIDELADCAQRLESLMHLIVSHSLAMKKIAPYLLIFTINLMVTNKRPTTLYSKIKTSIESICYDLISICDHRVGTFILRCTNDATRNIYETLCKEYKKYHKFKGKV